MPDYFSYEYNRILDGVFRIDNPDRTETIPSEHADTIDAVTDENAKALFNILLPATEKQKTLFEEISEHETFGSIVHDISMNGAVCSIRFSRELTEAEITELDVIVEAHKNNT